MHMCELITNYHAKMVGCNKKNRGNLWYKCLAYHKVSQSTSRFHCKNAKNKHHTSLHSGKTHKSNEREDNDQEGQNP